MMIDRSNYEIWFIDWLDGNLTDTEAKQIIHFLEDNPDLKEEFDGLTSIRLNPSEKSLYDKRKLKKTTSDFSEAQFDYLSAGYFEKDLAPDQTEELMQSIAHDLGKKKSFELMQKTRLIPPPVVYKYKKRLIRRTLAGNVFRMTLIGLSAAAVIVLAVTTYFSKPKTLPVRSDNMALVIRTDSIIMKEGIKVASNGIKTQNKVRLLKKQTENLINIKQNVDSRPTVMHIPVQVDSLEKSAEIYATFDNKIAVSKEIDLSGVTISQNLIAINIPAVREEDDTGRSRFGKLIAKTFREKLLKEKKPKDSPLKVYEIAEAGVSGLNKLLGWQMALDEKNDVNGEVKSVYFSSKLLKFNTQIKKTEPPQ
jgi:hypothetical protein